MAVDTGIIPNLIPIKVLVQFQRDGVPYQGDFMGQFRRLAQSRIDQLLDEDEGFRNSDVLDEVLSSVSGIGRKSDAGGFEELAADEQMAWVKNTPECVNAAVTAFFRTMRPERYNEKTQKRQRGRG